MNRSQIFAQWLVFKEEEKKRNVDPMKKKNFINVVLERWEG